MPNEIVVTQDMIEAGVNVLAGSPEPDSDNNASEIVAEVYKAMEAARRAHWPKWVG